MNKKQQQQQQRAQQEEEEKKEKKELNVFFNKNTKMIWYITLRKDQTVLLRHSLK